MVKRKGEKPAPRYLDRWSDDHPVARSIQTGGYWFQAWVSQKVTPWPTLSKRTGIVTARFDAISHGDVISRAELDALAIAWETSAGDIIASMPSPELVVD